MKLNCKPGDLAICIGGDKNLGRVVSVVRALRFGEEFRSRCGLVFHHDIAEACWVTEGWFSWEFDGATVELEMSYDRMLRPLRAGDGDDETLTWPSKPEGVAA